MSKTTLCKLALAFAIAIPMEMQGQGCSQCRDNVAQTNPEVQAGYREAILLLLGAATVVTAGAIVMVRKMR